MSNLCCELFRCRSVGLNPERRQLGNNGGILCRLDDVSGKRIAIAPAALRNKYRKEDQS